MPALYNRIARKKLRSRTNINDEQRITLSFYKYFLVEDAKSIRDRLYTELTLLGVFGRIYVAGEGINAQVSVPASKFATFTALIRQFHPALNGLYMNIALENGDKSFWMLRIKVRKQIVADGIDDASFNPANTGNYIQAEEVNALLDDPNVQFVDMRNCYEYELGHFDNALNIPANTFAEQLAKLVDYLNPYREKRIVMYCTGGIRCEKASAWAKHNDFKQVSHLAGGIIGYVKRAREQNLPLRFRGKNFVFDERLGERVTDDIISKCHQCGNACDTHVNCANQRCHLLFIQCPTCAQKYAHLCRVCSEARTHSSLT